MLLTQSTELFKIFRFFLLFFLFISIFFFAGFFFCYEKLKYSAFMTYKIFGLFFFFFFVEKFFFLAFSPRDAAVFVTSRGVQYTRKERKIISKVSFLFITEKIFLPLILWGIVRLFCHIADDLLKSIKMNRNRDNNH